MLGSAISAIFDSENTRISFEAPPFGAKKTKNLRSTLSTPGFHKVRFVTKSIIHGERAPPIMYGQDMPHVSELLLVLRIYPSISHHAPPYEVETRAVSIFEERRWAGTFIRVCQAVTTRGYIRWLEWITLRYPFDIETARGEIGSRQAI